MTVCGMLNDRDNLDQLSRHEARLAVSLKLLGGRMNCLETP